VLAALLGRRRLMENYREGGQGPSEQKKNSCCWFAAWNEFGTLSKNLPVAQREKNRWGLAGK